MYRDDIEIRDIEFGGEIVVVLHPEYRPYCTFGYHAPSEEGFHSVSIHYALDAANAMVSKEITTNSRDCDGEHSSIVMFEAPILIQPDGTGALKRASGEWKGIQWETVSSENRDQTAEAAGY